LGYRSEITRLRWAKRLAGIWIRIRVLDNTEMGLTEGGCETGSAIFGIALVDMSGRVSYVEFCNNGIYFRTSIIRPLNCNLLHFCGFIEKNIEPTKEGAKHILSHVTPLIFI
jgi:hypothetical protein